MGTQFKNFKKFAVAFVFDSSSKILYAAEDTNVILTSDISNAKVFNTEQEAEEYAKLNCNGMKYSVFPTTFDIIHTDDIIN